MPHDCTTRLEGANVVAKVQEKAVVEAVDLFCGAGGLTYGLRSAGIKVVAGIDSDPACAYPFGHNNGAEFIEADIREVTGAAIARLYSGGAIRLLAGCAPCTPFSPYRRGGVKRTREWSLLSEFARLVGIVKPELVTMENVPDLASKNVLKQFVKSLENARYHVDVKSVYCPRFGIPQHRRRLVLMASRIGEVAVPLGSIEPEEYRTVEDAIRSLTRIDAGGSDPKDRLHRARTMTEINLRRLRASKSGGTWRDWLLELRAPCHRKSSGATYQSVYARMKWDQPSPTITTEAHSFGSGRFGHPEQDRPISLREAAILQTFPRNYRFVGRKDKVYFSTLGRLIGNAVPPKLARTIGAELLKVAATHQAKAIAR